MIFWYDLTWTYTYIYIYIRFIIEMRIFKKSFESGSEPSTLYSFSCRIWIRNQTYLWRAQSNRAMEISIEVKVKAFGTTGPPNAWAQLYQAFRGPVVPKALTPLRYWFSWLCFTVPFINGFILTKCKFCNSALIWHVFSMSTDAIWYHWYEKTCKINNSSVSEENSW